MVVIFFWDIVVVMKSISFMGGVVRLMVRLMDMMIVKWIGLMLRFRKMGLRIGLRMMIVGFVLRNIFIMNRSRLIRNNRSSGFLVSVRIYLVSSLGVWLRLIMVLNDIVVLISKRIIVEVMFVWVKMLGSLLNFNVFKINRLIISVQVMVIVVVFVGVKILFRMLFRMIIGVSSGKKVFREV